MNGKSFISVFFSENQILIALLDGSKKRVKKYAAATLPSGLIKNYKVTNTLLLAKILKEVWKKLKIKQKSVSIVIPEYSTFIKILKVSKIAISEINEALNWQLGELLPYSLEDAVTDWKILKKQDKDYSVLSVSIEKSILQTYLTAFEAAELFPIVVEVPSVSLSRLFESKRNQLVIYATELETMFILQDEGNLVGSSIIDGNSVSEIVSTATRMINHYKETKIDRIVAVGVEIGAGSDKLKVPIELYKNQFSGLSEADGQKFLIPLSSQTAEMSVPNDPFSLNLIPNALIKRYKAARLKLQVWSMSLAVTLFIWISFMSALVMFFILTRNISVAEEKIASLSVSNSGRQEYLTYAKEINDISKKIKSIKDKSFPATMILNQIDEVRPSGVIVNNYKVDLETGVISIVGISDNRSSLVNFRDSLEKLDRFESPEIPVSSYEKETELDFEIILKYTPALTPAVKKETPNAK